MPHRQPLTDPAPPGASTWRPWNLVATPWPRRLGWLAWLAWLGIAAAVTARFAGRAGDDVYITYRYAYNLAHGRGLVFNPGERVFGVSDPGVAMLLAGLHRATGIEIPVLGTGLSAMALLVIAGTLLAASRAGGRAAEAWVGGTLLLASTYVWLGQGAGPLPALALLLLAAHFAGSRRPWQAGVLAGLAFCCRPDAALGAALLALLLVAEEWRPAAGGGGEARRASVRLARPLLFTAAFTAIAALALAAAWRYFGTPLPGTLAAKRAFAALAPREFTGLAFWRPAVDLFCDFAGQGGPLLLLLGVLGQVPLWVRAGRPGRLLVLYSLALAVFYTLAAVPFFIWYTIPTAIAALYGAPFALGEMIRRAGVRAASEGAAPQPLRRAAVPLLAGLGAAVFLVALAAGYRWWRQGDAGNWRLFAYRTAGEWIRGHTPPEADVAFDEVGILAYYSDHPVVDLIGLVTPRSRPFAAVGDPLGAFLAKPPELLLFHTYDPRGGTRPILFRSWFASAYEQVATISSPTATAEGRIYRRRSGASIPPPRPPWPRPKRIL